MKYKVKIQEIEGIAVKVFDQIKNVFLDVEKVYDTALMDAEQATHFHRLYAQGDLEKVSNSASTSTVSSTISSTDTSTSDVK